MILAAVCTVLSLLVPAALIVGEKAQRWYPVKPGQVWL